MSVNDSECVVILMIAWRKGSQGQQVDLNTAKEKRNRPGFSM